MGKHGKPLTTATYLTQVSRGHPLAWPDGRVRVHRAVLYDKIGPGPHPCAWCGRELDWFESPRITSDHLDGDTWNNDPDNLVPACLGCNGSRRKFQAEACIHGHAFTDENTYYRKDATGQWPNRQCIECSKTRKREAYEPKRVALDLSDLTVGRLRQLVLGMESEDAETHVYAIRSALGRRAS